MGETDPTLLTADYARYLLILLLEMPRWVIRRVKTIRFVGDDSLRLRVSTDFDVRECTIGADYGSLVTKGILPSFILPLGFLKKAPLVDFDLWDAGGRRLSLLTQKHGQRLTVAMLLRYAEVVLHTDASLLEHQLQTIVGEEDPVRAKVALMNFGRVGEGEEARIAQRLMEDVMFRYLITSLAVTFVAFVVLPRETVGERHLVDYSYLQLWRWDDFWLLTRIGWRPAEVILELPLVRLSGSYHVEPEAPETVELKEVQVRRRERDGREGCVRHSRGCFPRVHLWVEDQALGEPDSYILRIRLGPQRRGLLTSALVATALTTLTLALLVVGLATNQIATTATPSPDRGPIAAVLILLPAAIAAYISRPSEHPLASQLYLGLRSMVGASALFAFLAAAMVALEAREVWMYAGASILFVLAASVAAVVAVIWGRARVERVDAVGAHGADCVGAQPLQGQP